MAGTSVHTDRMYQLIVGCWASQVVGALARFGVPDLVQSGSRSADAIAGLIGGHADTVHRLLRAGVSLGVLAGDGDGRFGLTPLGATLTSNSDGSMLNMAKALTAPGQWLPW